MASYVLSPTAENDLAEIFDFTMRQWSEEQADAYIRSLFSTFRLLARSPLMGTAVERLQPRLRQFVSGRHIIFYFPVEDGVDLVRSLHSSRNVTEILREP